MFHNIVYSSLSCTHTHVLVMINRTVISEVNRTGERKKKDWLLLQTSYIHINPQFAEVYKQSCVLSHSVDREVN